MFSKKFRKFIMLLDFLYIMVKLKQNKVYNLVLEQGNDSFEMPKDEAFKVTKIKDISDPIRHTCNTKTNEVTSYNDVIHIEFRGMETGTYYTGHFFSEEDYRNILLRGAMEGNSIPSEKEEKSFAYIKNIRV